MGTAERVCSRIKNVEMSIRKVPGTRIANPSTGDISYAPPEGATIIADKLADWERFLHDADDDLDPLVRMAVGHDQFEAIHPFHDGNGRTGRILNILVLIDAGLISEPILYLSRYIIRRKSKYYRLLDGVTRNRAWEPWILYVLAAVERTARSTLVKTAEIRLLQSAFREDARAVSRGGRNAKLLSLLFEQPYGRIGAVMERCQVSRPTATGWLNDLVGAGLLRDHRFGRERLFVNFRLLEILQRDDMTTD